MNRQAILIAALSLCFLPTTQAQAKSHDNAAVPTIAVTELEITDKALKLTYEIRNTSERDIWICDSVSRSYNFEVYLAEDERTLTIRKRLDVASSTLYLVQPCGRYIRLRPAQKRVESLLLTAPVDSVYCYYYGGKRQFEHFVANATRLSLEIGYYVGNLPEMFIGALEETEKADATRAILFNVWFGGVLGFNNMNESSSRRDDEVFVPYTQQKFVGERVLQTIVDDPVIPYRNSVTRPRYNPPDLSTCTRVEIEYEPSVLEYFYPYRSQQELLSRAEMEYLNSEKTVVVGDSHSTNGFANEIAQADHNAGGIVAERGKANVFGYRDSKRVRSFVVYDDTTIETEQKLRIRYQSALQSLRTFTPQIQPFELRMQCAANLKSLWYRMRLYDRAEKSRVQSYDNIRLQDPNRLDRPRRSTSESDFEMIEQEMRSVHESEKRRLKELYSRIKLVYPAPRTWCDSMEWAFVGPTIRSRRHEVESKMKVHVCPGVGEGLSTYAMNPNCRPDSPGDMVLLFETEAGWNQHGGAELFTFDNHNPKGGCVLLNDGTVKFIRTTEELQQLRWK